MLKLVIPILFFITGAAAQEPAADKLWTKSGLGFTLTTKVCWRGSTVTVAHIDGKLVVRPIGTTRFVETDEHELGACDVATPTAIRIRERTSPSRRGVPARAFPLVHSLHEEADLADGTVLEGVLGIGYVGASEFASTSFYLIAGGRLVRVAHAEPVN